MSKFQSGTHPVTHPLTKVRYRAARAAKNIIFGRFVKLDKLAILKTSLIVSHNNRKIKCTNIFELKLLKYDLIVYLEVV